MEHCQSNLCNLLKARFLFYHLFQLYFFRSPSIPSCPFGCIEHSNRVDLKTTTTKKIINHNDDCVILSQPFNACRFYLSINRLNLQKKNIYIY